MQEKEKKIVKADESLEAITLDELRKYLSSSLFTQVGPKSAKNIVSTFGTRTIQVIEKSSHELFDVDGVGRCRVAAVIHGWTAQHRLKKSCMILLQEGGDHEKRDCE